MTGHQKDILFVLTALLGRLSGNHQKQFQTIFGPKICIFLRYAHVAPIFGLRLTQLNGIITSPHHEVTLDNFGFPVGGRSAARRAVFRPPGRILAIFGGGHDAF